MANLEELIYFLGLEFVHTLKGIILH